MSYWKEVYEARVDWQAVGVVVFAFLEVAAVLCSFFGDVTECLAVAIYMHLVGQRLRAHDG